MGMAAILIIEQEVQASFCEDHKENLSTSALFAEIKIVVGERFCCYNVILRKVRSFRSFLLTTYLYILLYMYMDTTTNLFTPAAHARVG